MTLIFLLKLIAVLFFLAMFVRRPSLSWGIGLLAVTSALLLDTFLGTFGQEELKADLGFFFYIIAGSLFAGGGLWLWTLLRPALKEPTGPVMDLLATDELEDLHYTGGQMASDAGFDRKMLFRQIRERLGPQDVYDLIFDLEINENDVLAPKQPMSETIVRLMDLAEKEGKSGEMALAVERTLTPLPPESLPRLEKLSPSSPATVLRHYLLTHYHVDEMAGMAVALGIDPEQLGTDKRELARNLLLHLSRRSRLPELLKLMKETKPTS